MHKNAESISLYFVQSTLFREVASKFGEHCHVSKDELENDVVHGSSTPHVM